MSLLFPMHSTAGWFILMWTPRVIILSMCTHRTRKPAERDINPRSRYFRCFGQKVSCYPRPPYTRMPMPLYNYRIFDQASAWPSFRVPRKETYDFIPSWSSRLDRFSPRNVLLCGILSSYLNLYSRVVR